MNRFVKVASVLLLIISLVFVFGCKKSQEKKTEEKQETTDTIEEEVEFEVTSTAFQNDNDIPKKYAHTQAEGGENISIPLEWKNLPEGTKSIAITMVDKAEDANDFLHWLVINIDPKTESIAEGVSGEDMQSFATEFNNDYGDAGYGGPAPPKGDGEHDYEITVWALDIPNMGMTENSGLDEFESFVEGKVLGKAVISGEYTQE